MLLSKLQAPVSTSNLRRVKALIDAGAEPFSITLCYPMARQAAAAKAAFLRHGPTYDSILDALTLQHSVEPDLYTPAIGLAVAMGDRKLVDLLLKTPHTGPGIKDLVVWSADKSTGLGLFHVSKLAIDQYCREGGAGRLAILQAVLKACPGPRVAAASMFGHRDGNRPHSRARITTPLGHALDSITRPDEEGLETCLAAPRTLVTTLVQGGCPVDSVEGNGSPALSMLFEIVAHKYTTRPQAAHDDDDDESDDEAARLAKRGRRFSGTIPLEVEFGIVEAVKTLLELGASPNQRCVAPAPPRRVLDDWAYAAPSFSVAGALEMLGDLKGAGADFRPLPVCAKGCSTNCDCGLEYWILLLILRSKEAGLGAWYVMNMVCTVLEYAMEEGGLSPNVRLPYPDNRPLLVYLTTVGLFPFVEFLLSHGADPHLKGTWPDSQTARQVIQAEVDDERAGLARLEGHGDGDGGDDGGLEDRASALASARRRVARLTADLAKVDAAIAAWDARMVTAA